MTNFGTREWLERELSLYPSRSSTGDFFNFALEKCREIKEASPDELVRVLREWILLEDKIKSVLAIELSVELGIGEVDGEISNLLVKVKNGLLWQPYYAAHIERILSRKRV